MKYLFTLFLFVYTLTAFDVHAYEKQFIVKKILNDEIIQLERLDRFASIHPGDLLLVYSHSSKTVLGYARVENVSSDIKFITASVVTHNKSGLIREDNYLRKIDLSRDDNEDLTGRFDLMSRNLDNSLAQYRPLVYAGLSQGFTAAGLLKGELLVGPTILGYGINRIFQISSNTLSTIYKVPNIAVKASVFRNDDYELALEAGGMHFSGEDKNGYYFSAYLDMVSNSQFNSYFKVKAFSNKPADDYFYNSGEYEKDLNLEFSFSYGYLFDNWNRLIFGPKLDVNKQKVGGNIGYYFINKEFHALIGVTSNDFSEFKLGKDGYLLNLDFWWRF